MGRRASRDLTTAAGAALVAVLAVALVIAGSVGLGRLAAGGPSASAVAAPDRSAAVSSAAPTDPVPGTYAAAAAAAQRGGARRPVHVASAPLPHLRLPSGPEVRVRPRSFHAFRVRPAAVRARLRGTPDAAQVAAGAPARRLSVPGPDGAPHVFALVEDPVLAPRLQARHPEIRTYTGRDVADPAISGRFDLTPLGFHALVRDPSGSWLIDPVTDRRGETRHLSYRRSAAPPTPALRESGPPVGSSAAVPADAVAALGTAARTAAGAAVVRRTYRLALVSDPGYAAYFGSANVLAAKASLINRVDEVYNDDLAIKLELVDGTDRLNLDTAAKYSGADGPCGASACFRTSSEPRSDGCGSNELDRTNFVIGQIIGADRYDVGHLALGGDPGGGGLAALGVVGGRQKASGCTGVTTPAGDLYAIDYVAHELGHQFGANHTFDGSDGACGGGNRNPGTSVEPGSGSSVMAYAGICGADDLQPHTDPYFSQRSISEITATVGAAPSSPAEVQSIALTGFDTAGETITLSSPGSSTTRTLTLGGSYTASGIASAVAAVLGSTPTVSGYDGAASPSGAGFTLTFARSAGDVPRVEVGGASPGVAGGTGVLVNGGPGTNGGTTTTTTNHAPSVTAPPGRTIPVRTPFALTGAGSDPDGDPLVYLWEQNDTGGSNGSALTDDTRAAGPLFRVFGTAAPVSSTSTLTFHSAGENSAGATPSRTFPDLAQVLAGNTNAATGTCPTGRGSAAALECHSEVLPTAAYAGPIDLRLTARDRSPLGGGTQFADTRLAVGSAGPLLVTSQPAATTVAGGSQLPVTWQVNGTDGASYAPQVQLQLLYLDGSGAVASRVDLGAPTANDGQATVTVPGTATGSGSARLVVQAVGNYFFAVNAAPITITPGTGPSASPTPSPTVSSTPSPTVSPTGSPTVSPTGTPTVGPTGPPGTGVRVTSPQLADGGYRLASDLDLDVDLGGAASATCSLDGASLGPCETPSYRVTGAGPGTHVFTATADGASASFTWTVPFRATAPEVARSSGWTVVRVGSAYGGRVLATAARGRRLSIPVTDALGGALVVTRLPRGGSVQVTLNGRLVGTVATASSSRRYRAVVPFDLGTPTTGRLVLTTTGRHVVAIEGVAVRTR